MLKLGNVPFINSKPLFYAFEKELLPPQFAIEYHPPYILSKLLAEKKIDLGLIPVAELVKRGGYKVIPDISISSFGRVDSVLLISKKDISQINKVALDMRSQSSSSLLRVIFNCFYGLSPEYVVKDHSRDFFSDVDAGMIIGDAGLQYLYSGNTDYTVYDLGEIWTEETGLPFVYAVLAVNMDVDLGDNAGIFQEAKKIGKQSIDEICKKEHEKIGIDFELCKNYISNRIRYDLGDPEVRGIQKFAGYLNDIGITAKFDKLDFY